MILISSCLKAFNYITSSFTDWEMASQLLNPDFPIEKPLFNIEAKTFDVNRALYLPSKEAWLLSVSCEERGRCTLMLNSDGVFSTFSPDMRILDITEDETLHMRKGTKVYRMRLRADDTLEELSSTEISSVGYSFYRNGHYYGFTPDFREFHDLTANKCLFALPHDENLCHGVRLLGDYVFLLMDETTVVFELTNPDNRLTYPLALRGFCYHPESDYFGVVAKFKKGCDATEYYLPKGETLIVQEHPLFTSPIDFAPIDDDRAIAVCAIGPCQGMILELRCWRIRHPFISIRGFLPGAERMFLSSGAEKLLTQSHHREFFSFGDRKLLLQTHNSIFVYKV